MLISELQGDVAAYSKNARTDPAVQAMALSGIQDAYRKLNSRDWSWAVKSSGFAFQANVQTVDLPTDFRTQRHVSVVTPAGQNAGSLSYYDPKSFQGHVKDQYQSWNDGPSGYTIINPFVSGQITLSHKPSQGFVDNYPSGIIYYYGRLQLPVNASEPINLPDEAITMVLWYARATMAMIDSSEAKVGLAETRWREAWKMLVRDEQNRQLADSE